MDAADEATEVVIQEFAAKWNLQDDAVQFLLSLDPESQLKVLQEFSPRDASRDVNGIFWKFARGVKDRTPQKKVLQESEGGDMSLFIEQWSLGPEAQSLLMGLSGSVRERVMKEFAPRDASRDANGIFLKFAQGIAAKGAGGGGKGGASGKGGAPFFGGGGGKGKGPGASPGAGKGAGGYRGAFNPAAAFAQKWNLNADNQALLHSLPSAAQQKILAEFAPRDTSRDANGIFWKFAQSIAAQEQSGAPRRQGAIMPNQHAGSTQGFIQQWKLNADAQAILLSLAPDVQQKVMQEFSPRDVHSDCNNIFMKFAQGMGGPRRCAPY